MRHIAIVLGSLLIGFSAYGQTAGTTQGRAPLCAKSLLQAGTCQLPVEGYRATITDGCSADAGNRCTGTSSCGGSEQHVRCVFQGGTWLEWEGGGGGGTPGGSNEQVQWNDNGLFNGIASGTEGQVLTSHTTGPPTFEDAQGGGGGTPGGSADQIQINNGVGGFGAIANGTDGQVLTANASGPAGFADLSIDSPDVLVTHTPTNYTEPDGSAPCNADPGQSLTNHLCAIDQQLGQSGGGGSQTIHMSTFYRFDTATIDGTAGESIFRFDIDGLGNSRWKSNFTTLFGYVNVHNTGEPFPTTCTADAVDLTCNWRGDTVATDLVLCPYIQPPGGDNGTPLIGDTCLDFSTNTNLQAVTTVRSDTFNGGTDVAGFAGGTMNLELEAFTTQPATRLMGQCSITVICQ